MTENSPQQLGLPTQLSDSDYLVLASFRRSLRIFLAFSEQAARKAGLTLQQHQAILAIRGFSSGKGVTVGDLADHLLLKHHTTVELVDRLVGADLVLRTPDAGDRRRVLLKLTSKAEKALEILSAEHLVEIRRDAPLLIDMLRQLSTETSTPE